jgi:phage tail tape-measure protein
VSKVATPVTAIVGAAEVAHAYKKGGTDAAVKQASKTVSGLGTAWLGAKAGAAIGSIAGPIGTVVGGAVGGVLGYFAGEKAMDMIMG